MHRTLAIAILTIGSIAPGTRGWAEPAFDWRKPSVRGDVTDKLASTIRDHTLDLTVGKIILPPSADLTAARVDATGLHLTIQLLTAKQRVQFNGLVGASGKYKPNGWRARVLRISRTSHSELFVRKGVLTLVVRPLKVESIEEAKRNRPPPPQPPRRSNKPTPKQTAPPLLPGPESGYKPRNEQYAKLAAIISGAYKMPGRNTHRDYKVRWMEAARAGVDFPSAEVREYAEAMLNLAKEIRQINVAAVRRSLLAQADEIERRINSGAYTRQEQQQINGGVLSRTVDDSASAWSRVRYLRGVARKSDADLKEWQAAQLQVNGWGDLGKVSRDGDHQYGGLVLAATKFLFADAEKHAGPRSASSLVQVSRPDSALIKMRNASGKRLTDVYLSVSVGTSSSDKYKRYGVPFLIFVPVWEPGHAMELDFALKKPSVLHFWVSTFANEASSKDHKTSLIDPKSPPDNSPGRIVFYRRDTKERAWAEIDGKRHTWEIGEDKIALTTTPGKHKVLVKFRAGGRNKIVYNKVVSVDAGQNIYVRLRPEKK